MSQINNRRGGLGRGLAALIPDTVLEATASLPRDEPGGSVRKVPLTEIRPNPEQPRRIFDRQALEELANSIRTHGILSPLVVRPGRDGYVLIAGERRLRASGLAGLEEVPVLVRTDADDAEVQLELALVENLQREDLDPVETARGYARLQQDFGYTQEEIASKVGKDRTTVANALRLLKLPEKVLDLVQQGRLTAGHARALVPVQDPAVMREILSQILARDLSVRATERLVRSRSKVRRAVRKTVELDRAIRTVSNMLSRRLSTAVEVKPKARGKGGRIVIDYYTNEDLERIMQVIKGPDGK